MITKPTDENPNPPLTPRVDRAADWGDGTTKLLVHAEFARRLERELNGLRRAIEETLAEHPHLADGDNCTLIKLKRAIEPNDQAHT